MQSQLVAGCSFTFTYRYKSSVPACGDIHMQGRGKRACEAYAFVYVLGDREHGHMYLNKSTHTHTQLSSSMCSSFPSSSFVCVCVCVWAMHVHISIQTAFAIHSSLPRALSQSLPTYAALFFLFSSVHCFGLQLLYLFRLTGGLALPLGFRTGNGEAEKGVDNRNRQGLDHPRYPSPKYDSTIPPTPPPPPPRQK